MLNFIDQYKYFSSKIVKWYESNKRDLPWRKTKDPYKIWLSEIILQQTKVSQGLPYYNKFVKEYPTVNHLANASEDSVLKNWQGLGYYSRARNLHSSAKYIANELKSKFPENYSEIIKLKGVGDYTASAISSFAFEESNAVVDGNVFRVLSRFYGIETPIDSSQGIKEFKDLSQKIISETIPSDYNQSIMEFGALQCIPKSPKCRLCPINSKCYAFANKQIDKLPLKKGKTKVKTIHYYYFVIESEDEKLIMKKRQGNGIWKNLFDFPLIESDDLIENSEKLENLFFDKYKSPIKIENISSPKKHLLSHRKIYAYFIYIHQNNLHFIHPEVEHIPLEKIKEYPIPKLIENYLREETNLLHLY